MYLGRRPFKALGREPSYRTSLTNGSKAFSFFSSFPIFSTSWEPLSFLSCSKPNPTGSTDLSAIPFYQHPMVTWTEHRGFFCVGNISFPSSHHHRSLHFCIQAINQHTILSISECWDRWWVKSSIDIILWMSKSWKSDVYGTGLVEDWRLTSFTLCISLRLHLAIFVSPSPLTRIGFNTFYLSWEVFWSLTVTTGLTVSPLTEVYVRFGKILEQNVQLYNVENIIEKQKWKQLCQ